MEDEWAFILFTLSSSYLDLQLGEPPGDGSPMRSKCVKTAFLPGCKHCLTKTFVALVQSRCKAPIL